MTNPYDGLISIGEIAVDEKQLQDFYRAADERATRRAQPGISNAAFMATIKYTGDVDRLTPEQYTRYCRIKYGDPNWGRRGYG